MLFNIDVEKKIPNGRIEINLKYTDYFSITGSLYQREKGVTKGKIPLIATGCIHDDIKKYAPELAKYIKWHLFNKDTGPIHYIANVLHLTRDRTHPGKKIGEPVEFEKRLKFSNFPITFKEPVDGFFDYILSIDNVIDEDIEEIKYDGNDNYNFSSKWSITGFIPKDEKNKWYKAPFDKKYEAEQFLKTLQEFDYKIVKIPTKWCKAVEPKEADIRAAKKIAIWEDATLEQLRDKEALLAHLKELKKEFSKDMKELLANYS